MTFVLSAAALWLAAGCGISDDGGTGNASQGTPAAVRYEGEWRTDGHSMGRGYMMAYGSDFALSDIPYAAILRTAMPRRAIECGSSAIRVVPYDNIGYSQQAVYMRLTATQWMVPAMIDGKLYTAVLCMANMTDPAASTASATYSKVSGVYNMSFPLKEVRLLDADRQLCETVPAAMQITFVSVTRIK